MKAGAARICITPEQPICLAGYAARTGLSEGVYHDIYLRALALEGDGGTFVLLTADLVGFDPHTCELVKQRIQERSGIPPHAVLLNASHTHTAPEIRIKGHKYVDLFDEAYSRDLVEKCAQVVAEAAARTVDVTLSYSKTSCALGVNRRLRTPSGTDMRPNPGGITDPEVTILRVDRDDKTPLAVVFSYPCHPTSIGGPLIGGDYPGFAEARIESSYLDCTALFVQGCGGDQKVRNVDGRGAFKSGPVEDVRSLGEELARAVLLAVGAGGAPVDGPLVARMENVALPLQEPDLALAAQMLESGGNKFLVEWGREMLRIRDEGGEFLKTRELTVHTLSIGDFVLVGLGGEICVGYSLRFKRELAPRPCIIAGYSNGMIGYIPTASMMPEGGYEVNGSYYYDMMPAPYAPEVEEIVCAKVHEMIKRV